MYAAVYSDSRDGEVENMFSFRATETNTSSNAVEVSSTVSGEGNVFPDLEDILAQLPDVLSVPPRKPKDSTKCITDNDTSMSSLPCAASGGPTLREDTDKPADVQLLWPLEVLQ